MKDLFSKQSTAYARFRPRYPEALFAELARIAPSRAQAWDAGTGNGQAAVALAQHFDQVLATDLSAKQLEQATQHPRVRYEIGKEQSGLAGGSCDLVTVAQAFHWFDQEAFYAECQRVLRPRGGVAIWCYSLCKITPEIDALVEELYEAVLGPYWEPERRQVEQGYRQARFPFEPVSGLPEFEMREDWSAEHLIGYLSTWSALQAYIAKNGTSPLERFEPRIRAAWGDPARVCAARWKVELRVGRVR